MQRSNIYKKMEKYGLADKLRDDEDE
jgi:hypothetical protein